jgi:predicted AAA+ superfamily ATPase
LESLIKGGYPEAILRKPSRSTEWFRSYLTAIVQRDIRDLAQIDGLTAMPNVLAILASRAACLLNTSDLTRDCAIPNTTLKRYLSMLEMIFIIYRLPAWSVNLGKRLIKAPKIMLCDTGLACHLLDADIHRLNADGLLKGRLLENFVANELFKQTTWLKNSIRLFHYRSASGQEIDFILEYQQGRVVALEVKASNTIRSSDFAPMRVLQDSLKSRFLMGVILHDGSQVIPHGQCFYSAPISCLWASDET